MGCICSKKAVSVAAASPVLDPGDLNNNAVSLNYVFSSSKNPSEALQEYDPTKDGDKPEDHRRSKSKKGSFRKNSSFSFKLGFSHRRVDAEQIAAGWPPWLTQAAAEAVHGWIPLRAESFEKLDKIGQGTYSSVFRAREVETGRMLALKKVRFDNFQPESIRFMAREIMILRRLDHPNIMKLEGVIASRVSSTIYLVFEYMEHDLSGLNSCSDITLTEPQIKCYMKQLLLAVEHCHLRGIMHRDIKASNILVNNQGILKLGDFGLANFLTPKNRQRLTSRVVTLWYRPPELLMGSNSYNVSVDIWSIGCVFAELLNGKPILKGRTEVEQLHKIFKLCGSPPEEYWKKGKLPHGDMFKPQHPYEGCLRERCKDFPKPAVDLIETCLSVDPSKRGTASSALMSEYFRTAPYACDPSSLPKYPPRKEMDAKDDSRRKKARAAKMREAALPKITSRSHQDLQETNSILATKEEQQEDSGHFDYRNNDNSKGRGGVARRETLNKSFDASETSKTGASQGDSVSSVFTAPPGAVWIKREKESDAMTTFSSFSAVDASNLAFANPSVTKDKEEIHGSNMDDETTCTHPMQMQKIKLNRAGTIGASDVSSFQVFLDDEDGRSDLASNKERELLSGPLLSGSCKIDELLLQNESDIRQADRRSRFCRDR